MRPTFWAMVRGRSGLFGTELSWVPDAGTVPLGNAWGLLAAEECDPHPSLGEENWVKTGL